MTRGTQDSAFGQRAPSLSLPLADGGRVSLEVEARTEGDTEYFELAV